MSETMTEDQQAAARSKRLQDFHQSYITELRQVAPTFCEFMEDAHATVYSVKECELLAETSPDDGYVRGVFYGRAQLLRELQAITGRTSD